MYFEERKESYGFHAREFGLIYYILQIKRKKNIKILLQILYFKITKQVLISFIFF